MRVVFVRRDIPVQRQSAIVALQLDRSFVLDAARGTYSIRHRADAELKGRGSSITVHLPQAWTAYFERWVAVGRPTLMPGVLHDYLFVTKQGKPRRVIGRVLEREGIE